MARAWRALGKITDLEATGGSTTTIVSTYSPFTADDNLNNGTAIVVRDAGGAGAAPEGQFSVITDYVASTKTWTIGAKGRQRVRSSGDRHAVGRDRATGG
jgi:hypothetical protein